MNISKLGIIIRREYLNKVKKKSFLIITFLAPVLFAAIAVLPSVIMMGTKEEAKKVGVLDASGIVTPFLESNEIIEYVPLEGVTADEVKADLDSILSQQPLLPSLSDAKKLVKGILPYHPIIPKTK